MSPYETSLVFSLLYEFPVDVASELRAGNVFFEVILISNTSVSVFALFR
jgi:hypothetical protein